jgi:hypothetical protein
MMFTMILRIQHGNTSNAAQLNCQQAMRQGLCRRLQLTSILSNSRLLSEQQLRVVLILQLNPCTQSALCWFVILHFEDSIAAAPQNTPELCAAGPTKIVSLPRVPVLHTACLCCTQPLIYKPLHTTYKYQHCLPGCPASTHG